VLSLQQFLDPKPSTKVPEDNFTDLGTVLNYQRCISSAFFNPGAALYRASKFAAAIRFIRIGCQIGAHSLSLHHASEEARKSDLIMKDAQSASNALVPEQTSDSDRTNPWAQLEEQLYPRWDLLGSCCVKTGDRQVRWCFRLQLSMLMTLSVGIRCIRRSHYKLSAPPFWVHRFDKRS
jgi:hypothetical protein